MDFEFKHYIGARQSMFAKAGGRNYIFWIFDGLFVVLGGLLGVFFIAFSWFLVGFKAVFNGFSWFLHGFSGFDSYCEGKFV